MGAGPLALTPLKLGPLPMCPGMYGQFNLTDHISFLTWGNKIELSVSFKGNDSVVIHKSIEGQMVGEDSVL